jgi:WD40 repeat protein
VKEGRKVLAGTQDGVILLFNWGKWGDCLDRYPGHPEGVDCMLRLDDDAVLTGSSDGLIRAVSILPNRVLGVIGDHDDFPVEGLRRNPSGRLLASYAHDNRVRFWDLSMFVDDSPDNEDEGLEEDLKPPVDAADDENGREDMNEEGEDHEEAWEDISSGDEMDEEESGSGDESPDESDSDMSEDSEEDPSDRLQWANRRSRLFSTAAERFFADL